MKIGLLINPIAGMGGAVGLKGTDGQYHLALKRGATPRSEQLAASALAEVTPLKDQFSIYCGGGHMGRYCAEKLGIPIAEVCGTGGVELGSYTVEDTRKVCRCFLARGVDLLVFAGGDGTARDVLDATEGQIPVVAIPCGIKMHSGIFASKSVLAGQLLLRCLRGGAMKTREIEVMDLDEELYRQGIVAPRLYGYLKTPYDAKILQGKKSRSLPTEQADQQSIAWDIVDGMEPDTLYLIGPGSTTACIVRTLELPGTLIGFDGVADNKSIAEDLNEADILALLDQYPAGRVKLVLTPVGGQGILLGRGNQQASSRVLRQIGKDNIIVAATKNKLAALGGRPLLVDTGDEAVNRALSGYYRVVTGYREAALYKVQ